MEPHLAVFLILSSQLRSEWVVWWRAASCGGAHRATDEVEGRGAYGCVPPPKHLSARTRLEAIAFDVGLKQRNLLGLVSQQRLCAQSRRREPSDAGTRTKPMGVCHELSALITDTEADPVTQLTVRGGRTSSTSDGAAETE